MLILTILNTIAILVIFSKIGVIKITIREDRTFSTKILLGYDGWIQGTYFRIPIRNKRKIEFKEYVDRMINSSYQSKFQSLNTKFSWLKTWEQVYQFEKDYSVVNRKIVENLVANFVPNK